MWTDKRLYWCWNEDRKKGPDGEFLTPMPAVPSVKRIDYVTINKGTDFENLLAIGVWDDEKYRPLNREQLEFYTKQHTLESEIKGGVLVNRG